eukprot:172934_1
MPKKKTMAKKKKQLRQARDRERKGAEPEVVTLPCNVIMECDKCKRTQKSRAFCYFCEAVQRLPRCAQCARQKCMGGDCLVKHGANNVTGMQFVGAICDFCLAWVCHSKKCIVDHSCPCPLADASCIECGRGVENNGGRYYKCATCYHWLCEEDQFEHQVYHVKNVVFGLACDAKSAFVIRM